MSNRFELIVKRILAVDLATFEQAILMSPNAQGYIAGAISEILLKRHLMQKGYEILRIKEKWEGDKHQNHHGDFYIRIKGTTSWFVLESKGVKSNSEKWHKLYNYNNLIGFLTKHIALTPFKNEKELESFVKKELPLFLSKYSEDLYTFNDIKKYNCDGRSTCKAKIISKLKSLPIEELEKLINERLNYVMSKIRVIETHLVSGGSEKSARTQATPRIDEFNILGLDLFIRTEKHNFLFANPKLLEPSSADKNHLQQNYIVAILFSPFNEIAAISPWENEISKVKLSAKEAINEKDMQIDHRGDNVGKSLEEDL
jgi:hypothetical protein